MLTIVLFLKYRLHIRNILTIFQCPWRNYEIEENVEFVQKIIKNIRSARATYNLPNKIKTDAFIVSLDPISKEKIIQYKSLIETLAYSALKMEEPPAGCAIITITDKIQVHILLEVIIMHHVLCIMYIHIDIYYNYVCLLYSCIL